MVGRLDKSENHREKVCSGGHTWTRLTKVTIRKVGKRKRNISLKRSLGVAERLLGKLRTLKKDYKLSEGRYMPNGFQRTTRSQREWRKAVLLAFVAICTKQAHSPLM